MQRGLRRAATMRIRRVGVKPVLDDVVVNRGQFHGDELADLLINDVKFVSVVSLDDFLLQLREFAKNPAVKAGELVVGNGMFRWVKIVKIRELVAQRVANTAVGLRDFGDALLAHDDVIAEILR
jgi:hypothetical protein